MTSTPDGGAMSSIDSIAPAFDGTLVHASSLASTTQNAGDVCIS